MHPVSSSGVGGMDPPLPYLDDVERSDLAAVSLSGVRWVSLARFVAETLAFGSSVVLAHLISPAEFGRAAVALGVAVIAPAIAWAGFGAPVIQMRSIERGHVEVATFLSIVSGVFLTLATVFVLAPYAVEPVFGSRVAYLLEIASPIFVLAGVGTVPNALLQRRLAFRRLSEIEIVATAAGPLAAIVLAIGGLNGEALILGGVVTALVATVLTLITAPLAAVRWRRREASRVAGFGIFAALSSVAGVLFNNIDYAILGARLPAREVGFYWRAYQLGIQYQTKISGIMLRLAFPIYARTSSLEEMRRLRSRIVRVHTVILYPMLTVLIVVAPELVPLVFGSEWEPAVFPTQVLAVAGMGAVAAIGVEPLLLAAGKPRPMLYYNLVLLAGYGAVVTWASGYGLRTVVIAVAVYQVVLVAGQFFFLESRQVGIPLRETWTAVLPAVVAAGVSLAGSYPAARAIAETGTADVVVVLAGGTFALGLYALGLRVLFPAVWSELRELTHAFVGRRAS